VKQLQDLQKHGGQLMEDIVYLIHFRIKDWVLIQQPRKINVCFSSNVH
jgi:hypothetical protein